MLTVQLNPIVAMMRTANDPIRARIQALAEAQDGVTDEQRREAIIAAHQPGADPALRVALAAAREEIVNLSVHADNIVLSLFNNVEMGVEDDWIQKVNRQDQTFKIYETHTYGEAPQPSYARPKSTERFEVDRYATGIIDYPSEHGIMGRIDVADEVNSDMIRAWNNQINDTLDPLITAALGSFTPGETYVRDPRFVADTLPTTNVLTNTGEGAFTFEIYKDIVEHFDLLQDELKIIRLNPTEMRDTWAWQHLVSTTGSGSQDGREMITTDIKDGIIKEGEPRGQLLGRTPLFLKDPTFAKKKLQIFGLKPAGDFYSKPHLDVVMDFDEKDMKIMRAGSNLRGVEKSGYWKGLIYGPQALNFAEMTFES